MDGWGDGGMEGVNGWRDGGLMRAGIVGDQ